MKTSFCSVAFRNETYSITDICSFIDSVGYDAVEVWGNHLPEDADGLAGLAEHLRLLGMRVSMISPYFDLTGDEGAREKSLQRLNHLLEAAGVLGSPLIRVFTGLVGSAEATADQWQAAARCLRAMGERSRERGIRLALETHPRTLVDCVPSAQRLLALVDHPAVGLNLDIYHMWEIHGDAVWVLELLAPHVMHVHAKNARLSEDQRRQANHPLLHDKQARGRFPGVTSLAEGDMKYQLFLESLQRRRLNGYVSVEWFGEEPEEAARRELAYLKRVRAAFAEHPGTLPVGAGMSD